jgi:bifunctional UDP-N-acetylglucosamine pyrophosphorylase/glucosamine-1-phosphate N-acetyltransferase
VRSATLRRLVDTQASAGDAGGTILTAVMEDPRGYGRVLRRPDGRAYGVVEQKAGTPEQLALREVNMGLYCWRNDLFWKHVDEIQPSNPVREYYLTDMVEILFRAGHRIETLRIEDPQEVIGINDRVQLAEVDAIFRARKTRELMLDGVTIEKPETVVIDKDVRIGMDTVIEPFVQIAGKTTIGEACRIGAHSIVRNSQLGDEVELFPYTIVNTSVMERATQAGPYARLRMENHMAEGAHIGNFVELKKTRLGAGSKAMHLTYLGDSTIGSGVNVGAGTITCNYDGVKKSPTVIGDEAFVGSNSILVAPVEIGPGSYTAAGSIITDNVPADALGVGRARQTNKEGWAAKRRERVARKAKPVA